MFDKTMTERENIEACETREEEDALFDEIDTFITATRVAVEFALSNYGLVIGFIEESRASKSQYWRVERADDDTKTLAVRFSDHSPTGSCGPCDVYAYWTESAADIAAQIVAAFDKNI